MAKNLTINSKVRLNSGYDMPLMGYGVGIRFYREIKIQADHEK